MRQSNSKPRPSCTERLRCPERRPAIPPPQDRTTPLHGATLYPRPYRQNASLLSHSLLQVIDSTFEQPLICTGFPSPPRLPRFVTQIPPNPPNLCHKTSRHLRNKQKQNDLTRISHPICPGSWARLSQEFTAAAPEKTTYTPATCIMPRGRRASRSEEHTS